RRGGQDRELDVAPRGSNEAEQRRHVLYGMCLQIRDAIRGAHCITWSQTDASRAARAGADHLSSASRLIDTSECTAATTPPSAVAMHATFVPTLSCPPDLRIR